MSAAVAYPSDFLSRPCDRQLTAVLCAEHALSRPHAEWLLYRMWADFATGGGARRRFVAREGGGCPVEYLVIEEFCRWSGGEGELVRAAVDAGFLRLDEGQESALVAVGYEEANRMAGSSVQRKGGHARAESAHRRRALEEAVQMGPLYEGAKPPSEVRSLKEREMTNALGIRIYRALGLPEKDRPRLDPDLPVQLFELAVEVVRHWPEKVISDRLRELLASRGKADSPGRVDAVLRRWVAEIAGGNQAGSGSEGEQCPTCGHPLHTEGDVTRCTWCAYCRPAGTRAGSGAERVRERL